MTTHDQHTHTQPTEGVGDAREDIDPAVDQSAQQPLLVEASDRQAQSDRSDGRGLSADETQAVPAQAEATAPQPDAAVVSAEPSSSDSVREPTESSAGRALFADDELAGLTARWDSVQAAFVDDPRECVHKADGLVSDVVQKLTSSFSDARARLEEQWGRGEEASTEDLRVALKQYREFFQRLLAV
jgi:hypothetical protein